MAKKMYDEKPDTLQELKAAIRSGMPGKKRDGTKKNPVWHATVTNCGSGILRSCRNAGCRPSAPRWNGVGSSRTKANSARKPWSITSGSSQR